MTTHYNKLKPDETERLGLALEEMGEALQVIGKIVRHGLENWHPENPGVTNRQLLEKELGDVRYAMTLLCVAGDVSRLNIMAAAMRKGERVRRYLHHQSPAMLAKALAELSP